MFYYLITPLSRAHQHTSFTYHADIEIPCGSLVAIEVGKRQTEGIVIKKVGKPTFTTKPIGELIESIPLPLQLVALASWLSTYYGAPETAAWHTILPRGLTKKRRDKASTQQIIQRQNNNHKLTTDQLSALAAIRKSNDTTLLQGVTGSGKTTVYIESAKNAVKNGKSVIVLVPEIGLTSQLVGEFTHHFTDITVTHSKMTEAERHIVWKKILHSTTPQIIIGPRSALFMPLQAIGLIVIDECHEPSFKQEQAPRYSALRAARILAKSHSAKLILGSATPLVTDRYLAEKVEGTVIRMDTPARTVGDVTTELVDSRNRRNFTKHRFLSNRLIENINETLAEKKQVLIFHNRRGSASTTLCESCGWHAICERCFIPLTLHNDHFQLICHVCGNKKHVPTHCPECSHTNIIHRGIGTKLIADELQKMYPNKKIARFDGDAIEGIHEQYQALHDGAIDIIVGTQSIAKGLDLPHLSLVGVVQADSGLTLPDYTTHERVFQLLYQVFGRVGRNESLSKIVVQSFNPDHPAIQAAIARDYEGFYTAEISKRKTEHFPPFSYLLKLTCAYKSEAAALRAAKALKSTLQKNATPTVRFLGPSPAFYERTRDTYRWQLVLRSSKREDLTKLLEHVPAVKWQSELDPMSLL